MKYKNTVSFLVCFIIALSILAAGYGIFSRGGPGESVITSVHGQQVTLYGKGLYQNESASMAVQAIAQDKVTLLMGIPLLILSIVLTRRGLFRGRLLLVGTLGYFLYTYTEYSFLAIYNPMFLIYVMLLGSSFFAFTLTMMSFNQTTLETSFRPELPANWIGGFLFLMSFLFGMMWLGRILNPMMNGTVPVGLDHYSTLVIQVLDLGIIIPVSIVTGILVIRRRAFGYLLASVVILKSITLMTAITAMMIGMIQAGKEVSLAELLMFPLLNLAVIICMVMLLKNVREETIQ